MNKRGAPMTKGLISVFVLGLGLMAAAPAAAELRETTLGQNRDSAFMQEFGRALAPIGHVGFCRRFPAECTVAEALRQPVPLTPERRHDLRTVNTLVNDMIEPVTDQELYGRLEHWTYPASKGDCEDYVLLKRRLLMERGWPASALLITVVRDENGEGHAILTVRTSEGDFLLDNKRAEILPWNQSAYSFVKRQATWDPNTWISLAAPASRNLRAAPVSTSE